MAKANLTLPDGTKVNIEGGADEVATVLARFSGPTAPALASRKSSQKKASAQSAESTQKSKRKGPQGLIEDLARENYFKTKRTIGDVQKKLEEKGHIYALYSLSSPLLRLTRSKVLRRIKEKNGWVYVN